MYILAIDQGTTGTTSVIFDDHNRVVKKAYREFMQIYPQPGWVEHDPLDIWQTVVDTVADLLTGFTGKISVVGLTNQRETTVLWDKTTGKPVYNAIVWQCRRTAKICDAYRSHEQTIREKTGLPLDPYFSGTKLYWLLENVKDYRIENLLFGTIDTWLIWNLTDGAVHATDYTNASRTMLFNIKEKVWDRELLDLFNIPESLLPEVKNSAGDYGTIKSIPGIKDVQICGIAGDQQSALFGQKCFTTGQAKNTYGTGCFLLVNTGEHLIHSASGLLTTLAVGGQGRPCYALEGSIFIAGAVIQWLRDELRTIADAGETESAALSVTDNGGVYFVPAFVGLGAPHWDAKARGIITGLTRGSTREHIIRAALESLAYQTYDVINVMEKEAGVKIDRLSVDGGATANEFLMQFQADILNRPVVRPEMAELTALGAATIAGLHFGIWKDADELLQYRGTEKIYTPALDHADRNTLLAGWQQAVRKTRTE